MREHRAKALERGLKTVQIRIDRWTNAVAAGRGADSFLSALAVEDAKKKDLARKVAEVDGASQTADLDASRLRKVLLKEVSDLQGLLSKSIPAARQGLRKVFIEGRLS